jgi:hypothetical protein
MKTMWDAITANDVRKAIELFDQKNDRYPEPRNTFLIFNGKKYPAKHIRGLAYLIAYKKEISKSEYSGGQETATFLKKLGFSVQYKRDAFKSIANKQNENPAKHKIARLVVTGKQYDKKDNPVFSKLEKLIEKFLASEYQKRTYDFLLTPGGFMTFEFPDCLQYDLDIIETEEQRVSILKKEANAVIVSFIEHLKPTTFRKLKATVNYFTIGIDGFSTVNNQHIELVAIYDFKKEKVIGWTGKFYPTERQIRDLIKINDLDTHFIELNNQKLLILGCHDLNVFNPRGQASARPGSWKKQLADNFKAKCRKFKPEIILHHPHTTDTPNIWNLAWRTVDKELPSVKHFASGIKYYNINGVRGDIDKVLEKTKKGDVKDFFYY